MTTKAPKMQRKGAVVYPQTRGTRVPQDLLQMLTYRRPADSDSELEFIERFIKPLGAKPDGYGNYILRIGDAPVLWSCHTDTVHSKAGRQNVRIDGEWVRLARDQKDSSCLGSDDGAGVWLLSELIKASVPGLYVFHRGEEVGGLGSTYIAEETPELLVGIQMAIAVDRKGKTSVISHQGTRCCSDKFAKALGNSLVKGMVPDDMGLFTDTANYTHLIPECTNLSVGYEKAHSPDEKLHVPFLLKLRDALVNLDVLSLPIDRDPTEEDEYDYGSGWNSAGLRLVGGDIRDYKLFQTNTKDDTFSRLMRLCEEDPACVADILMDYGVTPEEIEDRL